jgi:hypothetical protein
MARTQIFRFRVNQEERQSIIALAEYLSRSRGDAVRFLIQGAVNELKRVQQSNIKEENEKTGGPNAV